MDEVKGACDDFMTTNCLPLRFVGKYNLETLQRDDIGALEYLADSSTAEILPINVARIKLGGLFNVKLRLSQAHCPAAKKHVVHKVTREDPRTGEPVKVMSYLFDQKDGKYTLGFPITAIVPHTVSVEYMGQHIKNSPYTIVFKAGPTNMAGDTNNSCASHLDNESFKDKPQERMVPSPDGGKTLKLETPDDFTLPLQQSFDASKSDAENISHTSPHVRRSADLRMKFSCFAEKNASYEHNKSASDVNERWAEPLNEVKQNSFNASTSAPTVKDINPPEPMFKEVKALDTIIKEINHQPPAKQDNYGGPDLPPQALANNNNKFNDFFDDDAWFGNDKVAMQPVLNEVFKENCAVKDEPPSPPTTLRKAPPKRCAGLQVQEDKIKAVQKCVVQNNFRFPIGCGANGDEVSFLMYNIGLFSDFVA